MIIDLVSLDWNETAVYLADNTTDWDLSLLLGISISEWWKVISQIVGWNISRSWIGKNFSNDWFGNFDWCWFVVNNCFLDWGFYWGRNFNWSFINDLFWFSNFDWCWLVSNYNFFSDNFIKFGCWMSVMITSFILVPSISLNDV